MAPEGWLRVAGFGTWLVAALITGTAVARGELPWALSAPWLGAFLAFGLAFAATCWIPRGPSWGRYALLLVQTVSSCVMVWAGRDTLAAATLVVVAGQLPFLLSTRASAVWVAGQTAALGLVLAGFLSVVPAVSVAATFGGFQLFAVAMALLAERERAARAALVVANAELHTARARVVESSRADERLRISRDLHDALGHHLTALSLQLDVASRLAEGRAVEHVRQAHAISRLLLADVRSVVGQLRESGAVDVAEAVRQLVPHSATLRVHLDLPASLATLDADRAQAIVRCVQEATTNALRHAGASNLWVTIADTPEGVRVAVRDDGHGSSELAWGNGLRGMRERFEALAGHLDVRTGPGGGFEVQGLMPRSGAA